MSALLACALAAAVVQEPLVFSAGTGLVRLEVLVLHKDKPVHGLSTGDFEVRDDGVVQVLEPAMEGEAPVDATLVLDTSQSTAGRKLEDLRRAARTFVEGLRDGERAALLDFREEVRLLVPPTLDHDRVRQELARVKAQGSTALHDAVYAGLRLHEPSARRNAVVVFSDGVDSLSWLEAAEVVDAAKRSDALVYAVAVREKRDPEDVFLEELTRATGGRSWTVRTGDDLPARFRDVLQDIRARYVLSYIPTSDAPGWHTLEVKLRRGKGEVVARPTYWRAASP